jgi:ABC-type nitrate/sulfonate/bicarbonate transport system substrate-binding protein
MRPVRWGCVALLFALLAGGCGGSAAQPAAPSSASQPQTAATQAPPASKATASGSSTIRIGLLSPAPFYWPNYIADTEGMFRQAGVNVQVSRLGTPTTAVQALVGGSLDVAQVSADAFIEAIAHGAPITMVGQEIGNPDFFVVAQPGTKSWSQLEGATVAVSNPKSGAAIIFDLMARAKGLKHFSFVPIGTTPNRFAALKAHQVKAAIMVPPDNFTAVQQGFQLVDSSAAVVPHISFIMIGAQTQWAKAHRALLVHYLGALGRAVTWLNDPSNKDAAIALLVKQTKQPKSTVEETYNLFIQQAHGTVVTPGERIDMQGLQNYGQAMASLKLISPPVDAKSWVDNAYAAAAQSSAG